MCRLGTPLAPIAEPLDGRWADAVRGIAAAAGVTVVVGMFTPFSDGRITNTLLITGGGTEDHYDKIHLYDAFGFTESVTVAPGRTPVVVTVDGVGVECHVHVRVLLAEDAELVAHFGDAAHSAIDAPGHVVLPGEHVAIRVLSGIWVDPAV